MVRRHVTIPEETYKAAKVLARRCGFKNFSAFVSSVLRLCCLPSGGDTTDSQDIRDMFLRMSEAQRGEDGTILYQDCNE